MRRFLLWWLSLWFALSLFPPLASGESLAEWAPPQERTDRFNDVDATVIEGIPVVEPFRNSHGTAATALLEYWGLRREGEPLRVLAGTFASFATRCLCDDPQKPIVWELGKGFGVFAGQRRRNLAVEEIVEHRFPGDRSRFGFDDYRRCIDNRTPPLVTFLNGEENRSDTWARYRLNAFTVLGVGYLSSAGQQYIVAVDFTAAPSGDTSPKMAYALYRWDAPIANRILLTLRDEDRDPPGRLRRGPLAGMAPKNPADPAALRPEGSTDTAVLPQGETILSALAVTPAETVAVHYFFDVACRDCLRAERLLDELRRKYPTLQIHPHNLKEPANIGLLIGFYKACNVPPEEWQGTLVVFVGNRCYRDYEEIAARLGSDLERRLSLGGAADEPTAAPASRETMESQFASFTVPMIAVAGLADGINPCAFGVLVFFFTYLRAGGGSRRRLVLTALFFTLGVFLAYFLMGLGLFRLLFAMTAVKWLAKGLYPVVAGLTLFLAVLTARDARRVFSGATDEVAIRLPGPVSEFIRRIVRRRVSPAFLFPFAFITGGAVSLLELACTGQIYFPVLIYIGSLPELRSAAAGWLTLYVTMFIVPLVILFGFVYFGSSAITLARFSRRSLARVKTALAFVLVALALYLVKVSGQVWGIFG